MAAIQPTSSRSSSRLSTDGLTLARSKRRGWAGHARREEDDGDSDGESSTGRGPLTPDTPPAAEGISGDRDGEGVPGGRVVVLRRRLVPQVERGGRGDETNLVLNDGRDVELRVPAARRGKDDPVVGPSAGGAGD